VKKVFLLSLTLGLLALPLHPQNVWSSKIDTFGDFVPASFNPNANGVVSVFTPATSITLTPRSAFLPGRSNRMQPVARD